MKNGKRTALHEDEQTAIIEAVRSRLSVVRLQVLKVDDNQSRKQLQQRLQRLDGLYHRLLAGEVHIVGEE